MSHTQRFVDALRIWIAYVFFLTFLFLSISRVLNDDFAHTQKPVRIRVDVVRDDRVHSDSDYIGSDIFRSVSDEKGGEFVVEEQSG